jgi:hypothetical protein
MGTTNQNISKSDIFLKHTGPGSVLDFSRRDRGNLVSKTVFSDF